MMRRVADLARTRATAWYRARPTDAPLRRIARGVRSAIARLETPRGAWFDLHTNGEAALLDALSAALPAEVVLDIGANTGEWYRLARRAFPMARIVLVEIAPPLWPALEELVAADDHAELAPHGLGATDERLTLRWYPDNPALTTTMAFPHGMPHEELDAEVRAMASFLDARRIDRADVVKVDVEGAELPIVAGLEPLLLDGRVGVVQFEYGQANIMSHALLYDYAQLAERTGYRLGRLGPDGVDVTPYRFEDEDFRPRNMVLCHPDLVAVVERFG